MIVTLLTKIFIGLHRNPRAEQKQGGSAYVLLLSKHGLFELAPYVSGVKLLRLEMGYETLCHT